MKWVNPRFWKGTGYFLVLFLAAFLAQFLYYSRVYSELNSKPQGGYDVVLMYTGEISFINAAKMALAGHTSLFISGRIDPIQSIENAQQLMGASSVFYNPHALTTDQNARDSSDFIRQKNYHQALLVTGWDHIPRALLLTRYYFVGSGVNIVPYAACPAPKDWWHYRQAWRQFFKLWGSLGRVVLHWVGVDDWPAPEWMP